jgi:hypothetical protein
MFTMLLQHSKRLVLTALGTRIDVLFLINFELQVIIKQK